MALCFFFFFPHQTSFETYIIPLNASIPFWNGGDFCLRRESYAIGKAREYCEFEARSGGECVVQRKVGEVARGCV